MINKHITIFVFLIALFARAYGMDQEVGSVGRSAVAKPGSVGRSCAAAQADGQAASSSSSRVERAHPERRDGARPEKMALAFILDTAAPRAEIGFSSVMGEGRADGAVAGMQSDFKIKRYACAVCGREFDYRRERSGHIGGKIHKDLAYRCLICEKVLLRGRDSIDHMCDEHCDKFEDGSYKCRCCGSVLKDSLSIKSHALDFHFELSNVLASEERARRVREFVEKFVLNLP